jgi:UDP-MurNAc hydroxylase
MEVTYLGHAAMMVEAGGTRILMDPWLTDPTYHGTWWHYPPLQLGVRDLPKLDFLYVSHEHPDHFDPPTLAQLDKNLHVIIADFKRKRFRDRLAALGFRNVTEHDFGREFALNGSGLTCRLIAPDRPWDDSAILVRDGDTTLLNVNDCHLDDATLQALGRAYPIDLAFLTFTGASQYPGCFDFPIASKRERWRRSKEDHCDEFVNWAIQLNTKRAVPAAGNFALLAPDQLFLNTPDYVNTPAEAIEALRRRAPHIEGLQMNPGDVWSSQGGLRRRCPPPEWDRRMEDIERLSQAARGRITEYFASEPPAPADLFDRFRDYFNGLLKADPNAAPRVGIVTWWVVTGEHGGDWVVDFTRQSDWVRRGAPEQWHLRITIPDNLVALGVSGQAIWEELVLSFRVRLARRPDRYMKDFWTWFCKL